MHDDSYMASVTSRICTEFRFEFCTHIVELFGDDGLLVFFSVAGFGFFGDIVALVWQRKTNK